MSKGWGIAGFVAAVGAGAFAAWKVFAPKGLRDTDPDSVEPVEWPAFVPYEPGHVVRFQVDYDSSRDGFITRGFGEDATRTALIKGHKEWGLLVTGFGEERRVLLSAGQGVTFSNPRVQGDGQLFDTSTTEVLAKLGKWGTREPGARLRRGAWALQVDARHGKTTKRVRLYMVDAKE